MTALIQGRTDKALTAQDPRSTKPLGQEVEVTQAVEKRQDRCLRTNSAGANPSMALSRS